MKNEFLEMLISEIEKTDDVFPYLTRKALIGLIVYLVRVRHKSPL